jgi:large subunit ribosomal protein L15
VATRLQESKKAIAIPLEALEAIFDNGAEVTPAVLVAMKAAPARGDKTPMIKILGTGTLTKKLTVKGCLVSASARAAIEKAGGTIA